MTFETTDQCAAKLKNAERELTHVRKDNNTLSESVKLMAPIAAYYGALLVAFGEHPSLHEQWDGLMVSMKLIYPEFDQLVLQIIKAPNFNHIMKTIAASNSIPHDDNFTHSSNC